MPEHIPVGIPQAPDRSPEWLEMSDAEIPQDQYPPSPEQASILNTWGIIPPMNNRVAYERIDHIRSADGMRGGRRRSKGTKDPGDR